MTKFIDLQAQYRSIRGEIDRAIAAVIADTAFIGGKYVKRFEEEFADYLGAKYCVGCGNGTDALEMLLRGLGIGPGDEVLVPAHTWIATAEAVTTAGATPIFVDTLYDRYTIDPVDAERRVTPKTKAVIPVHLYGLPAEMDEILALARRYKLKVIEDCAQAHGATYKGRKIGTLGDAAAFSFFPSKNLGAYGDGGCMVTSDQDLAIRVRMIANHGRLSKNDHALEGRNSRLDGLHAAILSAKLPHLDRWTECRRNNADVYRLRLEGMGLPLPSEPPYSRHVFHLYVVRVENREHVQRTLREQGIETGVHYPIAVPFLEAYARMRHKPGDFPVAAGHMSRILSLPMYAEMAEADVDAVAAALAVSEAVCTVAAA